MSTPRSGRGGDRVRATRGIGASNRGVNGRGRGNGSLSQNNSDRPAQGLYTRGQTDQHASRGGRGSANILGSRNTRGVTQSRNSNTNTLALHPTATLNSTPYASNDYKNRLDHIKEARPKIRQKFIKDGLMNPEGQMRLSDSVKLIGICTDMCPEYERVRRIVEEDVKAPECTPETEHLPRKERIPDESRMVKAYARSAAGMDVELVSEIRSPETCLKTIDYLFDRLNHDAFDFLHQWIWDRTRAVRKDLRTQRIERKSDISILLTCLERSARFLLLSTHHMARSAKEDYTHQQDVEQLNQTLMSLKERYADNRRANIASENEAEFWAYRLILAPIYANTQLENELHHLPSELRHNPRVKTAVEIFRVLKSLLITPTQPFTLAQSNWKRFWDLIKSPRVSYLMACAAEISFNRMRHVVLDAIWRAYRVGNHKNQVTVDVWTLEKLTDALGLDTDEEAIKFCEAFGFVFSIDGAGHTCLDIVQMGYANTVLKQPNHDTGFKPQLYSATIVEPKRYDRTLSAVIQGISVQQARVQGSLLVAESHLQNEEEMEDETSLFVPESSNAKANPFVHQANGVAAATSSNPKLNVFAPSTRYNEASATATNPFLKNETQASRGLSLGTRNSAGVPHESFVPSKDSTNHATSSSGVASVAQSTGYATPANPFLKGVGAAPSPSSKPNPFTQFAIPKLDAPTLTTTPQNVSTITFPGLNLPGSLPTEETLPPKFSFTSTRSHSQTSTAVQELEHRRTEQEQRESSEKEGRLTKAQEDAESARRARDAQEAEQRKKDAEAAERRRQHQLQEDWERKVQEEHQRSIREAQLFQAKEEEKRLHEYREKRKALRLLTEDVMFDHEEGLILQFIENTTLNIAQEVMIDVEKEKIEALGDEWHSRYQMMLKRAGLAKIIAHAQKKKRDQQVRERRKRLKEQRVQMPSKQEKISCFTPLSDDMRATADRNDGAPARQPPTVTSTRRANRSEQTRGLQEGRYKANMAPNETVPLPQEAQSRIISNPSKNAKTASLSYSQSYQQSAAPIDRTETDWFKLRALGIDPSKHRKRSFDSDSSLEKEETQQVDAKRPKLSPEPAAQATATSASSPLPTPGDQLARFRAVQQAFRKSHTAPLQLANGSNLVDERTAQHRSSNDLITRARHAVATSPTPQTLPGGATSICRASITDNHGQTLAKTRDFMVRSSGLQDFGLKAPDLGTSASTNDRSMYSQSASGASMGRPAYWQRASRFVPRHLYGKGPDAIRAYNTQYVKTSYVANTPSVAMKSLEQTSPNPTQLLFMPHPEGSMQDYALQQYGQDDDADTVDVDSDHEDTTVSEDEAVGEEYYSEEGDLEQYNHHLDQPYFSRRVPQAYSEDEDADSEMVDDKGEDEDEDDDAEEYGEGDSASARYQQGYAEEALKHYDEYAETGNDEAQYAQQGRQYFTPSTIAQSGPGGTQDDAIELSD